MYRRFLLIGGNRRGNHLLLSALQTHPQVHAYDQLLSHPWETASYRGSDFLSRRVFVDFPPEIKAVVFPLAWMSARGYEGFWESLEQHNFAVIYLRRTNLLKADVSMRIAQQSERWSITNTSEQSRATIHVDPVAAERKFRDELRYDEDSKQHFANRRSIHISYEDMTRHYDRTLGDVQDFLGVERRPLKPTIVKQEVRSLRDVISNFSQLEEAWKGTEWQAYLEDDPPDPKVGSVLRS